MNIAKSNIRISLSLSPGEPLITDDCLLHQKTLKILSVVNSRTCDHRVRNSPSTVNPYRNNDKFFRVSCNNKTNWG